MKIFTIRKVGYTAGVYGNSGEYFNLFMIRGNKYASFNFSGQYGPEYRVSEALKKRGFTDLYNGGAYGKLSIREDGRMFKSEHDMIKLIQEPGFIKEYFRDIRRDTK